MPKNIIPKITAILIITLLIAGTFSYVQYLINKPLKILKNYTIPTEFIHNNTKIALAWTDDNEGETLIIQSDKKEYNGFSSVDVYFSITNISKKDQDMDVVVWVGNEKVKVEEMERVEEDDSNFQFSIFNFQTISNDLMNKFSNRKDIGGSDNGYVVNDNIESGQTNYYKATIKYPPMSKGEFFIEAFGKENSKLKNLKLIQNSKFKIQNYSSYGHLDPWYSSNWNYKREITINASQIATTTSNFPVLATTTLDDLKTTTNGGKVGNDNGYDIIFVDDDDSTLLNFEREKYASTTGEIVYWIKTDISSTTDKTIYMYYGNVSATDQATTTGVWDDNFVMVQHLQETPDNTEDQIKDSTSNANDGQTVTMASEDQVAGQIDGSFDFDGGDDYVNCGNNISIKPGTGDMTWVLWLNPDINNSGDAFYGDRLLGALGTKEGTSIGGSGDPTSGFIGVVLEASDNNYKYYNIAPGYTVGEGMFNFVVSWNNSADSLLIYKNGIDVTSTYTKTSDTNLTGKSISNNENFNIARRPNATGREFNGLIDEVRISSIVRSSGWIETEYNNQSDVGSFITIGVEESRYNDWYSTNWKYRRQIDINSSQIATTTSGFPILATSTLDDLKTTANNGKVESENGYDIIFVNSLGNTLLNFEREKYSSTTGEIAYWIKTDISSTTDKMIYMYYGFSASSDQSTTTGVWDDNYKGVWHLAETDIDNDAGDIKDSTANANNGTTYNMNTDDQVAGQINGSLDFNGTDNYINIGDAYNGVKTISFWLKPDDATDRMILDIDATDYIKINANSKIEPINFTSPIIYVDGTIASSTDTNWHYAVIVSTTGVNASAMNISKVATSYFDGTIDEVRISSTARTAGWIETEYNNQSNANSFLTINAEESLKLVITTSAKTLTAGIESTAFTVQTKDLSNSPINMGSDTIVNLSSDSSLYSFASTTGGTAISSVTIPSGSDSVNFYYIDHKAGSPTITVTAANLVSDTQQQTVQARDPWYNASYQYRRKITLEADQIATTTDAFPMLVNDTLADMKTTTHSGNVGNDNGYDIVFTDNNGTTLLNFEREYYASTTGEIVYWIKTDISSTTDKTIYMYYGNASATDQATTTGVWDDNFVMVQHLQERPDNTEDQIKDSTSNANDGQTVTMASDDQVAGQIDGSFDFDGTGDVISLGLNSIPVSNFTYSMWIEPGTVSALKILMGAQSGSLEYRTEADGKLNLLKSGIIEIGKSTGALDLEVWQYVTVTYDSSGNYIHYINGNTAGSGINLQTIGSPSYLYLGQSQYAFYYLGGMDEVRVSNIVRTAGWIETEYNNQSNTDSFMTIFGAEEGILTISTDPKVITAGTESTVFTVQADHNVAADTTINLSSDSTGTYHFAATPGGTAVSSVIIPSGISSVDFYYTDNEVGLPTIVVAATNFVSDDQQQTVQAGWYNTFYQYRRQITLSADQIATTTSGFPILATTTLAELKTTTFGGCVTNDNGHDIVFVDSNGSDLMNFEKEKYASTTGEIVYWIKTDISSTTDKTIYMYYGNASATDQSTTTGVWDDNYVGVWHMDNAGAASTTDSTKYDNDGATLGPVTATTSEQIDGALWFDGADDYISIGNAYDGVKTISFWLKPDDATDRMILDIDATDYVKINANSKIEPINFTSPIVYVDGTVASSTDTNWHYAVITDTTGVNASAMNISKVASSYFDGIIDEVRISNTIRHAGWIETEYNNQVSVGSFMTFGAKESWELDVATASSTLIASQAATANGNIVSTGQLTVTARGFKYGLTETDTWTVSESGIYDVGVFKLLLESLNPGTTYYVRAYATNSDGTGYGDYISFTTLSEQTGSPIIFKKNVILKENMILR